MEQPLYKVQQRYFFRTPIRIKIPMGYPDSLFDELFSIPERIDRKFNSHRIGSVTDCINRQAGHFVDVDEETSTLFRTVSYWSDVTDGGFDMTITPFLRLWGFYAGSLQHVPSRQEIEQALGKVDYRRVEILQDRIRIDGGQEITTGGFLKGYAVDCLLAEIKRRDIMDAIVNAGGSSIGCINNEQHPFWQIQVNDPATGIPLGCIPLSNRCCSTTRGLNQTVTLKGNNYGHVFNTSTGEPVSNLQCGMITWDCLSGDILSTGLLHLSAATFIPFLEKMERYSFFPDGYLITQQKEFIATAMIADNFKQPAL